MVLEEKAKKIKLLALDVDGILTSGKLIYNEKGQVLKEFNIQDGLGLKMLQKTGVNLAIITAKDSPAVAKRMQDLEINNYYYGIENKLDAYNKLKDKYAFADENIAYMGDDLPDLAVLQQAGLSITVPNAPHIIRQHVHLITQREGGQGAVREVCELIMNSQHTYHKIIASYLQPTAG